MPESRRTGERLAALLLAGLLLLNFPLLSLASRASLLLGIPVLYLYFFVFWAVFIAAAALTVDRRPPRRSAPGGPDGPEGMREADGTGGRR